jgi:hypothetical protein
MWIEMPQQSRNRAFVKSLIDIEWIGGIVFQDLVGVDQLFHQARVVVFGWFGPKTQQPTHK